VLRRLFSPIEDADIQYQNSTVKIVAHMNLQELHVAETVVGPLQEGKEYEMRFWVALELVRAGYARFYEEDLLSFPTLNKIHWRETRLQIGQQISPLPDFFYPKLRRYLNELKHKTSSDVTFASEYTQAVRLARDIVNCRLKKIVNLAGSTQIESVLKSLSKEEQGLFENINSVIMDWSSKILEVKVLK